VSDPYSTAETKKAEKAFIFYFGFSLPSQIVYLELHTQQGQWHQAKKKKVK
jgi:hypothetical protein